MDPFANRQLSSVQIEDIERLITNSVAENLFLDYKQELKLDTQDKKKEFLRDISAFANSEGGTLVFGVEEDRDDNSKPNGLPKSIIGFEVENLDAFMLAADQLIKDGIDERLSPWRFIPLTASNGKLVLLLRITPSMRAPHMVSLGGDRRFYIRANNSRQEMSTSQIRDAVLRSDTVATAIHSMGRERAEKWRTHGIHGPFWMLHVVPLWRLPDSIDVTREDVVQKLNKLIFWQGGGFNQYRSVEGYKQYIRAASNGETCQVVAFRNGTLEFLDQYAFRKGNGAPILDAPTFEDSVFRCCDSAFRLYQEGLLQFPLAIMMNVSKIKGCALSHGARHPGVAATAPPPIVENEIESDVVVLTETPTDSKTVLKPLLDLVWNAFGYPQSGGYDANGKYVGYRRH